MYVLALFSKYKRSFHWVQMGFLSTTSLFTTHSHTTAIYFLFHPLAHRNTEPFHPTHVTQVIEREGTEEQKERGEKKNDGVCLCQGLMRRVMPWIGCSPWIPLVQSGLVMCDVERLSLAGHYSALSHGTLTFMPARSVCITDPESHMHALHYHNPTSFISLHFICSLPFSTWPTHTHQFFCVLQEHIFKLMKSDSYARFLRSNIYQDLLLARKKVSCTHWPLPHLFFLQKFVSRCIFHVGLMCCMYVVSN